MAPGNRYYPIEIFLSKGALVLEPNYRGSAGYGGAFRALNVRNLGVGDMADVMSGVDALVAQGLADPDRLGVMGWSQGGYISAFLATNTDRFKAISVGAGHQRLDDVLRQHRHHALHAAVPAGDAVGRSRDLRPHLADHEREEGEVAHAHPARRERQARAHPERLPALPRPARHGRPRRR